MSPSRSLLFALAIQVGVVTGAVAQDVVELHGRVTDTLDAPIARAKVELRWLEVAGQSTGGRRGRYDIAARAAVAAQRPPRTVTDDEGAWRLLVPPQKAAWLTVGLAPIALSITADDQEPWLHATTDPAALPTAAHLPKSRPGDRLTVRLSGARPPWRGLASIGRPFRVTPTRTIWLRERVDLEPTGVLRFDAPPAVAGEIAPAGPTARIEGYRVSIWTEDRDVVQVELTPGEHTLDVPPAPWRPRPVLGDRARPVTTPLAAIWRIEGHDVELQLDTPRVPLLGGEPPSSVTSPDGPIEIDAWDPDQPLFLASGTDAHPTSDGATQPVPIGDRAALRVQAFDAGGRPAVGAAIVMENDAARRMPAGHPPFANTDARGRATIDGLPHGEWRVLVHHSTDGEREAIVTVRDAEPEVVRVDLLPRPSPPEGASPPGGAVRIAFNDDDGSDDGWTEVGTLAPDGRLMRRRFPGHPGMILVEGLIQGPVTLFAHRDDGTPAIWAGQIARDRDGSPLAFDAVETRRYLLDVRDREGRPITAGVEVSLLERSRNDDAPKSSELFELRAETEPGRFALESRVTGALWLRVLGPNGAHGEVNLPADPSEKIAIELRTDPAAERPPPEDDATPR